MSHPSGPKSSEAQRVAAARRALPAVGAYAYLNTGTCGPVPLPAAEALAAQWQAGVHQGRIGAAHFQQLFAAVNDARNGVAALLGAADEEIALTTSTTHGVNIVLWGLCWSPGDQILTTVHEHPGLQVPLADISRRYGVGVRAVAFDPGDPDDVVAAFRRAATARTRLLAFSHVLWTNGAVLPVRRLAELARDLGAYVLVDGAQSVGALPVNPRDLGVHFYSLPGQKWLCGPEGTGALYVASEALPALQVAFGGYFSQQSLDPDTVDYQPRPGAGRFQGLLPMGATVAGMAAALAWLKDIGPEWIFTRTAALARRLRQGLAEAGAEVLTPAAGEGAPTSGLVSFRLPGRDPVETTALLVERDLVVRSIPGPFACVRASTGFFNTEDEIDALIQAVREMMP